MAWLNKCGHKAFCWRSSQNHSIISTILEAARDFSSYCMNGPSMFFVQLWLWLKIARVPSSFYLTTKRRYFKKRLIRLILSGLSDSLPVSREPVCWFQFYKGGPCYIHQFTTFRELPWNSDEYFQKDSLDDDDSQKKKRLVTTYASIVVLLHHISRSYHTLYLFPGPLIVIIDTGSDLDFF